MNNLFHFKEHGGTADIYFNQDSSITYISVVWAQNDHIASRNVFVIFH